MNNSQVAHLWANKSRESATGSSFYFRGDTIYSYGAHFPIARHYKGVVLFTTRRHSVTTARHCSIARGAISHITVFTVENPMAEPSKVDLKNYRVRIEAAATQASKARNPQFYLEQLQSLVNEANSFAEHFGFSTRFEMPSESEMAELKARAIAAAKKDAKARKARELKAAAELQVAIAEWIEGKRDCIPGNGQRVFLRARIGEQSEMQTSRGARVPLEDAKRAFAFVMAKRAAGWHRNGETFPVGEFHLDAVNEFGVVAGCHRIEWAEIERFAKSQNWI